MKTFYFKDEGEVIKVDKFKDSPAKFAILFYDFSNEFNEKELCHSIFYSELSKYTKAVVEPIEIEFNV